jgi:hypothetical protein
MTPIILILVLFVGGILLVTAKKPSNFRIARAVNIQAAPEEIFSLLNDSRSAAEWNPFIRKDPNLKLEFSGPHSGVGAKTIFDGSMEVGKGSFEIIDSKPPKSVTGRLVMIKPMACDNIVTYSIEPSGAQAKVTWAMEGGVSFAGKFLRLFCNLEKMCGGEFEKGLASLKAMAERGGKSDPAGAY